MSDSLRKIVRTVAACALAILAANLLSCRTTVPRELSAADLASPSQQVRDAAAVYMRQHFEEYAQSNLALITTNFVPGMSPSNVMTVIKSHQWRIAHFTHSTQMRSSGSFQTAETEYIGACMDGLWDISVTYSNAAGAGVLSLGTQRLTSFTITTNIAPVWAAPPNDFTGRWKLYYLNGVPASETNYRHGRRDGSSREYSASGIITCDGAFLADRPSGTWTWYNPDGTVSSIKNYESIF